MLASQRLDVIELTAIDGIRRRIADFTSSYMRNLVAAVVEALICQRDRRRLISFFLGNGHPIIVDDRITHRDRAVVAQIEVLVQFDFQFAIVPILAGNHTDVVGRCQIIRVGFSASNGKLLVQLHG